MAKSKKLKVLPIVKPATLSTLSQKSNANEEPLLELPLLKEHQQQKPQMNGFSQVSKKSPGIAIVFFQFVKLQTPIILILSLLLLLQYEDKSYKVNKPKPVELMNYEQFKEMYPRNVKAVEAKLTEESHREMLFNADSAAVARHNLAFMANIFAYTVKQSPFRSDRTKMEQIDILEQLDEFNYTKIALNRRQNLNENQKLDNPVSATTENRVESSESNLEKAGIINRWITRLFKGDSHFEIPNYPLDQQPDPSRVTHIDADLRDCSGDIKDQGNCGCCFAMSWNAYAEWHYCKQTGKRIDFSEQHIVDCGHMAHLNGCTDGYLVNVREFSHVFGFELEENYPYKGKQGTCKIQSGSVSVKTLDFTRLVVDRVQWEEVLTQQPILVEVHLPTDILSYKRGVHPGNNCDSNLAHGMLLIGHGRQEGSPYWILKNSMGSRWGENGFLRLSRDAPMSKCFRTGFISKFKFRSVDEERFRAFYDTIKFRPSAQADSNKQVNKKDVLDWFK